LEFDVVVIGIVQSGLRAGKKLEKFGGVTYVECSFCDKAGLRQMMDSSIVQFEFPFLPHLMLLMKALGKRVMLDEHGVEYLFSRHMRAIALPRQEQPSVLKKMSLRLFRIPRAVWLMELFSAHIASHVVVVSGDDRRMMRSLYGISERKIRIVPNCVDMNVFGAQVSPLWPEQRYIVFLANFNHLPNVYGAHLLVEEIMPEVLKKRGVLCLLVGSNPPNWLRSLDRSGYIRVISDVPDVRPYVSGAAVAVCPIRHGSGTSLKVLEYMALGKPVVSTSKGARGLHAEDGFNILIRDDPKEFAEAIVRLLDDDAFSSRIGGNARQYVMRNLSWDSVRKSLLELYTKAE
jgi:glycosyltransferase involved in cell wall biosynthesis